MVGGQAQAQAQEAAPAERVQPHLPGLWGPHVRPCAGRRCVNRPVSASAGGAVSPCGSPLLHTTCITCLAGPCKACLQMPWSGLCCCWSWHSRPRHYGTSLHSSGLRLCCLHAPLTHSQTASDEQGCRPSEAGQRWLQQNPPAAGAGLLAPSWPSGPAGTARAWPRCQTPPASACGGSLPCPSPPGGLPGRLAFPQTTSWGTGGMGGMLGPGRKLRSSCWWRLYACMAGAGPTWTYSKFGLPACRVKVLCGRVRLMSA